KLYACTRIWSAAAFTSRTTASVAPPCGAKYTATRAVVKSAAGATLLRRLRSPQHSTSAKRYREGIGHLRAAEHSHRASGRGVVWSSLAARLWLMAPTLRLLTALFQHPDASPLDHTIHTQPEDGAHHDAPQLGPLQPL